MRRPWRGRKTSAPRAKPRAGSPCSDFLPARTLRWPDLVLAGGSDARLQIVEALVRVEQLPFELLDPLERSGNGLGLLLVEVRARHSPFKVAVLGLESHDALR